LRSIRTGTKIAYPFCWDGAIEWSTMLQARLPNKPRAKSIRARYVHPDAASEIHQREARSTKAEDTIDWLALWALSVGFCGLVLAGTAFCCADDPVGASVILFGAASIIAVTLGVSTAPKNRS
jgi:hypothetical protein